LTTFYFSSEAQILFQVLDFEIQTFLFLQMTSNVDIVHTKFVAFNVINKFVDDKLFI